MWFDFSGDERALVLTDGETYKLFVEEFDRRTELWMPIGFVSCYSSLSELRKALFYDCDFFCDENAEFDKYGKEIFKKD